MVEESSQIFANPMTFQNEQQLFITGLSQSLTGEATVYVKVAMQDTLVQRGSFIGIGVSTTNVVVTLDFDHEYEYEFMGNLPVEYREQHSLYIVEPLTSRITPSSLFYFGPENKSLKFNRAYVKANNITGNFNGVYTLETRGSSIVKRLFYQLTVQIKDKSTKEDTKNPLITIDDPWNIYYLKNNKTSQFKMTKPS